MSLFSGSVFVALLVRTAILNFSQASSPIHGNMRNYFDDETFRAKWDILQQRIRCCGGQYYHDFASKYAELGNKCFPKSCCIEEDRCELTSIQLKDCSNFNQIETKIHPVGCMRILKNMYQTDLDLGMLAFAILAAFTAVNGVICVAFSLAYVGKLVRKTKTWNVSQGVRSHIPMEDL